MTTARTITAPRPVNAPELELHNGDRMTRAEFHLAYERMPENFRAELIGGIVYVASPLKRRHGTNHLPMGTLLFTYEAHTPGTESGDNTTILLAEDAEPQPDLYLRVLPEFGGQSQTSGNDYVAGAPELVAEITHSTRAIDLHRKRDDYARHGVQEYLVLLLQEQRLVRFDLRGGPGKEIELGPDPDGVVRCFAFPGLWIDPAALLVKDHAKLLATLQAGRASPEHAAFAAALAARKPVT